MRWKFCTKSCARYCFLSLFISVALSVSGFLASSASAAVPGSESLRVYRGFVNTNDQWVHENIAVNNTDQMILYPLQNQSSAIFRFLFYPTLTAQTSVKGVIFKDIDLSFYIEAPGGYTDVWVADNNLCTAPHIQMGGITGWTGTVSNCRWWFATSGDYNYIHYHFDAVISGNTSYSVTSSDLNPIYISVGTNSYNVANDVPIYQRAILASTHPVYFNNITYGSIQYATSATDALLQEMISHQDATTGAIEDLEQTTIENTDKIVDALDDNTSATEDLNDSITDSTITGDFTITTIEAFGPLGTIVNNLIAFVGDLLTIGSTPCQPLKPPLPQYAGGGTLDIACPSTFMQPYELFTDAADVIVAAYLWFKIAIYIYHSVENLRNPENDDEEFLQL